jgi:hypothetical protein
VRALWCSAKQRFEQRNIGFREAKQARDANRHLMFGHMHIAVGHNCGALNLQKHHQERPISVAV